MSRVVHVLAVFLIRWTLVLVDLLCFFWCRYRAPERGGFLGGRVCRVDIHNGRILLRARGLDIVYRKGEGNQVQAPAGIVPYLIYIIKNSRYRTLSDIYHKITLYTSMSCLSVQAPADIVPYLICVV